MVKYYLVGRCPTRGPIIHQAPQLDGIITLLELIKCKRTEISHFSFKICLFVFYFVKLSMLEWPRFSSTAGNEIGDQIISKKFERMLGLCSHDIPTKEPGS